MAFNPGIGAWLLEELEGTETFEYLCPRTLSYSWVFPNCDMFWFDPILVELGGFTLFILYPLYKAVVAFCSSPPVKP